MADINISEESAAYRFRAEVCRVRSWLSYIDMLQGLRSMGSEEQTEPSLGQYEQ
jgi:hypothetical protein